MLKGGDTLDYENSTIKYLREKANKLPQNPGVYIMKNSSGKIIYVGKAVKLKNRVSQYFRYNKQHTEKVRKMVSSVADFEYIVCDSEFEALILECSLIKQNMPKYNVLLKDDKGYHYIKVSHGEYPSITATTNTDDKDADYIGPYMSSAVVKMTVDEACKVFKLPQCSKQFPKDINKRSRACLNYHINNCSAPCCNKISKAEYNEAVKSAVEFIKGGINNTVANLKKRMFEASENLEFEKAAKLRDRITAIEKIKDKQKVFASKYLAEDIIAFASSDKIVCVEVFLFRNHKLTDRREYVIDSASDNASLVTEFITSYYSQCNDIPPRIVIDCEDCEKDILNKWFEDKCNKKVNIIVPKIGEQEYLLRLCHKNAAEKLAQILGKHSAKANALEELKNLLGLENLPSYIESYDISNTAGSENVAGMVVFRDGQPYRQAYKKFKIKSFSGQDDYRSMAEVIERRFLEYKKADTEIGFGKMPDIILLDGGKGQLSVVLEVLNKMQIKVPIFGMAKDSKHKTSKIVSVNGDIDIKATRAAYTLLSDIQEEVHRFAISYHKKLRSKNSFELALTRIEGIGDKKARLLLTKYKTISAIKKATVSDLCTVKGINEKVAQNILDYFNE